MIEYNINLDYNFNCYLDKLSEYGVPDNVINKIKQGIDYHYQLLYKDKIRDNYKELKSQFESQEDEMCEEAQEMGYSDGYSDGFSEGEERYSKKYFKLGFKKGYTVGFADGSIDFNREDMDELIQSYYKNINYEEH